MDIKAAALFTLEAMVVKDWPDDKIGGDSSVDGFNHVTWMLNGIELGYVQYEKAHRWLGWAQCAICINQKGVDLDTFKSINKGS